MPYFLLFAVAAQPKADLQQSANYILLQSRILCSLDVSLAHDMYFKCNEFQIDVRGEIFRFKIV